MTRSRPWPGAPRRPPGRFATLLIAAAALAVVLWLLHRLDRPRVAPRPVSGDGYLFCVWNVENLYDDRDDPRVHDEVEDGMGQSPGLVSRKIDRLVEAILAQNGGVGPDLLGLIEVENRRVLDRLCDALNARLPEPIRYRYRAIRENATGRHIAPALLSRLPLGEPEATRDFGIRRILEVPVEVGDARLVVLLAHWTSRVTDDSGDKRGVYGDVLYRHFRRHWQDDPAVDLLIAGDFNDEPDDPSVRDHLRAVGDAARVRASAAGPTPLLFNLMATSEPTRSGTYRYRGRWEILDQIVASPGLLDRSGWEVVPESIETVDDPALRRGPAGPPWAFGRPDSREARGYSDHFAVAVRLKVHPALRN